MKTTQPFDSDIFTIPHRPVRVSHDPQPVTDENGNIVTDEHGDPAMRMGGSTLEGYTTFKLTTDAYDRDHLDDIVSNASEWGSYHQSEWERYSYFFFDTTDSSAFEVRVLPTTVAIDVKANTSTDSIRRFIEALIERAEIESPWTLERQSDELRA